MNDERRPKAAPETPAKKSSTTITLTADKLAYGAQVWSEVGYLAAWHALRIGGEDAMRAARGFLAMQPWYAEIEERRRPSPDRPCPVRCGSCSRCICADAYARRGGRPYLGVRREAELAAGAR